MWKADGKYNYTELFMANMEMLYTEMSPIDLYGMRINGCVQLKENHNKVAIDESCEILNDHLKIMSSSSNLDSLVNKSLYISVARRCTQNLVLNNRRQSLKSSGASIPPTRKNKRKQ